MVTGNNTAEYLHFQRCSLTSKIEVIQTVIRLEVSNFVIGGFIPYAGLNKARLR